MAIIPGIMRKYAATTTPTSSSAITKEERQQVIRPKSITSSPPPPLHDKSPYHDKLISSLTLQQAEKEMEYLSNSLLYHDWLYYNGDGTEQNSIEDSEFDSLDRRQQEIMKKFPSLAHTTTAAGKVRAARVGVKPIGKRCTHTHIYIYTL
jgi:hypothetical protein